MPARANIRSAAGLALLLSALMLGWAALAAPPAQQAPRISPAARIAWGLGSSPLTPHPGVRFGVLPNGMRYALMRNASPAGGLAVRLRMDVGAMAEGAREQGFLHLIEHMIFHGSQNIPEGSLPLMLAHRGLKRLTDFDAFTTYDETVYRLELARADSGARETALVLMRDIAGRLLFTRAGVRGAKQKVREEIAARDAMQDRLMAAQNTFFLAGTPMARGPVAGTKASVARASPEALEGLYRLHYVPERATLVLVGDFDVAAAEREIEAQFSDWQPASTAGPAIAGFQPAPVRLRSGIETQVFAHLDVPTTVSIASVRPIGTVVDRNSGRDTQYLEHLGSEMLARRLTRIAAQGEAPFTGPSAAVYNHFSTARLALLEATARDRDWRAATQRVASELRRALEMGFSQSELDEQLAATRAALVREAGPRTSAQLADAIVDAAARRFVFTEPAGPSGTDSYLAQIKLADVNAAFAAAWANAGRLVLVTNNRRIADADAAIQEALQ